MPKMNTIAIREPGGPEVLVPLEMEIPVPAAGQILVKVHAAGVNRPDILQRQGNYNPPPGAPTTPGLEIAGVVEAAAQGTVRFSKGDKVCALVPGGGYAEYAVVAGENALPIPDGVSMEQAAGIPETFFTVWSNVFDRGKLQAGETFLIHGGTSGIGTTAIMLAKAFGAKVVATVGSDEKCKACLDLGADHAINYRTTDFVSELGHLGLAPDVILDMVGGDYIARNIKVANRDGRIVQIAFQKGAKVEADFLPLMLKRLTLTGSTLRPRPTSEKAEIARSLEKLVWPLLAAGRCKPLVFKTFPLSEATAAHRLMESGEHTGKIILIP
jgi:NADPH:quinone reductase